MLLGQRLKIQCFLVRVRKYKVILSWSNSEINRTFLFGVWKCIASQAGVGKSSASLVRVRKYAFMVKVGQYSVSLTELENIRLS